MPLTARPSVADNETVQHADAIRYLLADTPVQHALSVASGYVNLGGLHLLAVTVQPGRSARLLLGAAPAPGLDAELPLTRFSDQLAALRGERDFARFPPSRAAARLAEVDDFLTRSDVEVRRYTSEFLHGKAYLLGDAVDGRAALVSSANLTSAGMYANRELGLLDYNPPVVGQTIAWFDRLWARATPYKDELRALLFPAPASITPEDVYLRALLELYGEELFETEMPRPLEEARIVLADFQQQGYERARQKLERYSGVLYADGVGTGKTEIGLALIEEYAIRQGQHALVVAPAQLREMWQRRIAQARLPAQVVSYQQLASDEQLADVDRPSRRELHNTKDSYRLVVVDEAHALRNADNTWYRAMSRLLGGEPKHVVLLTATPVNNGLWDLFNLVMVFARHDRAFAPIGIDSLRDLFLSAGANERDAEALNPDRLFPLADAVSVRRDRRFIVEQYPGATFPDGTPLRFPEPRLRTRRYDLDAAHPALAATIGASLGALSMARYRPSAFELGAQEQSRERALAGLLLSAALKRFESCWHACLQTVERMARVHEAFIAAWDEGTVPALPLLRAVGADVDGNEDLTSWLREVGLDEQTRPRTEFKPRYREDVAADLELLRAVRAELALLRPEDDPKLALLAELICETPGKICVFATFSDTVNYLDAHLDAAMDAYLAAHPAAPAGPRERVVVLGGETTPDERTRLIARFCPDTVVEPGYRPPDGEVDLLLSTDVLSEGQNLQQAGAVVSYDMPWNPQRVIQRNGRVIRLRSPHSTVDLTTMLPAEGELEILLRLEARIQAKIVAAGVFGMESAVLEEHEAASRAYTELADLEDRLDAGDASLLDEGEEVGGSFAGEGLRALLLRAGAEGELARLRALPWGVGACFRQGPGVPSRGPAGTFFGCRLRTGERYWRYIRDEDVDRDDLAMLRRIDPGMALGLGLDDDLEPAWRVVVADIVAEHNARADPALADSRLPPSQRFALSVLRDPSVALPAGAEEADELLAVPRSGAVKTALAEVQRRVASRDISRDQAALEVVRVVREYGLTPVPAPPPLEPIGEDDVGVVCWMRVLPAEAG